MLGRKATQWDFQNKRKSGWTGTSSFVLVACEQAHLFGYGTKNREPARRMRRGKVSLHASY